MLSALSNFEIARLQEVEERPRDAEKSSRGWTVEAGQKGPWIQWQESMGADPPLRYSHGCPFHLLMDTDSPSATTH